MRTPIEPKDVRRGDLIRSEAIGEGTFGDGLVASEWVAGESDVVGADFGDVRLFLLDRPTPPVSLPSEPTLGWLTWDSGRAGGTALAHWRQRKTVVDSDAGVGAYSNEFVTAFTPATAVPTEALDELRTVWDLPHTSWQELNDAIYSFLAAIEARA